MKHAFYYLFQKQGSSRTRISCSIVKTRLQRPNHKRHVAHPSARVWKGQVHAENLNSATRNANSVSMPSCSNRRERGSTTPMNGQWAFFQRPAQLRFRLVTATFRLPSFFVGPWIGNQHPCRKTTDRGSRALRTNCSISGINVAKFNAASIRCSTFCEARGRLSKRGNRAA